MRRLISSKTLWPLHIAQGRAPEVSTWVAANGIDSGDVSTNHDVTIEDKPDGQIICYTAYARNARGSKHTLDGNSPVVEDRTVPLVVEPPEHWPTWALTDTPRRLTP